MNETGSQGKGRIIGMDIHPTIFSASALKNTDAQSARELCLHHQIDMDDLEHWYIHTNKLGDLYVMESCNNSFEIAKRVKRLGAHVVVRESFRIGQIHKAYLKDDKVDARKIARVYLSGLAMEVWQPDERTHERREILAVYERIKRDSVRNRIWSWLTQHDVKKSKDLKITGESGLNWILQCREWSERQEFLIRTMHDNLVNAQRKRKKLKRLMAYIGLQPSVSFSGENGRNGGLKHTGRKDIRTLLVQSAHAILRMAPASNSLATWGRAMMHRKKCNVVAIAVTRKLTVYIWYLLRRFFTPLSNLSTSFRTKLQKLAVEIGTTTRREMGYKTIKDFIQKKEKELLAGT